MSCCGHKRAALRSRAAVTIAPAAEPPPEPPEDPRAGTAVLIEYRGVSPARLHRAASGRIYTFTHARRMRSVAAADAPDLLQDGDFRPDGLAHCAAESTMTKEAEMTEVTRARMRRATRSRPTAGPLTQRQAAYLAELTGTPAEKLAGRPIRDLEELLRWRIDPSLLFFRRICGRVVRAEPGTGVVQGVPNATVHVEDTDCSFLGFFPVEGPWSPGGGSGRSAASARRSRPR